MVCEKKLSMEIPLYAGTQYYEMDQIRWVGDIYTRNKNGITIRIRYYQFCG